jgi:hypothetical protein
MRIAISFVNSYKSPLHVNDPYYNIADAIPEFPQYYGLMTGPAFTLPYAFMLLFAVSSF